MVRILTWNTLESGTGGAFSDGWGCPLEIHRRDDLVRLMQQRNESFLENEEPSVILTAQEMLTHERHERLRKVLLEEIRGLHTTRTKPNIDFMLFQEVTSGDAWDDDSPLSSTHGDRGSQEFLEVLESLYERVSCPSTSDNTGSIALSYENVRRVYVRKDNNWEWERSYPLRSSVLSGGCLVEFVSTSTVTAESPNHEEPHHQSLFLVNLHGKSRDMRDSNLRRKGMSDFWNEINSYLSETESKGSSDTSHRWKDRIILCGDWNTQLTDLVDDFRFVTANTSGSDLLSYEPVVGLLDNSTRTTSMLPYFSTNHEDGFLAQYDGCLLFQAPESFLELQETSWNLDGFMPKGHYGNLTGDFRYEDSNSSEKEGVYFNGIFLPNSRPSLGLSDHLRIYTDIEIHHRLESNNGDLPEEEIDGGQTEEHQRRPPRQNPPDSNDLEEDVENGDIDINATDTIDHDPETPRTRNRKGLRG